mmetsp:Transcript_8280/g.23822  ORF Transcript_8280/g.23822 Transcript_8280/m.23822 type:complete len:255 (+) Transcript_8280:775-1539(+)
MRAWLANSRSSSSRFSFSWIASFFWTCERSLTSCRAWRSATYRLSDSVAKFGLMVCSRRPRPSAARRLSSGMVYPREFFQLLMQAGTFHLSRSSLLSFLGGACRTGTASSAGPRGALTCLCFGGCMGSTCLGTIWMTRCAAAGLYPGASGRGVYLMNCVFSSMFLEVSALTKAVPEAVFNAVLAPINFCNAACVLAAADCCSYSDGSVISSSLASRATISSWREYTVLPVFVPPFTMASYETSPSLSTSILTNA